MILLVSSMVITILFIAVMVKIVFKENRKYYKESVLFKLISLIKSVIKYVIWMRTEILLFTFAFISFILNLPLWILVLLVAVSPLTLYTNGNSYFDGRVKISTLMSVLKILVSAGFLSAVGQLATGLAILWAIVAAAAWSVSAILTSRTSVGPVSSHISNRIYARKSISNWTTIWSNLGVDPGTIKLRYTKITNTGIRYTFKLSGRSSCATLIKNKNLIATQYANMMTGQNISTNNIRIYEGRSANFVILEVRTVDPLANIAPEMNTELVHRIDKPFPTGIDENGNEVKFNLIEKHAGVYGMTGSGKSGALHLITGIAAKDPNCVLYLADPKGGVELGGWADHADYFAIDHKDILGMLDTAIANMEKVLAQLKAAGQRNAWHEKGYKTHVIILDEIPQLIQDTATESIRDAARAKLAKLTQLGRAAKFVVIIAAQRPTSDQIPKNIDNNISAKIVLRLESKDVERSLLGRHLDIGPTDIPQGQQGRCYMESGREGLVEARLYHLPDKALAKWQETDAPKTVRDEIDLEHERQKPPIIKTLDDSSNVKDDRYYRVWQITLQNAKTVNEILDIYNQDLPDENHLTNTQISRVINKMVQSKITGITKETESIKKNRKYISFSEVRP